MIVRNGSFYITTNKRKLDLKLIHRFLKNSYWAKNIPFKIVCRAIKNSLCFGVFESHKQIGFARVITDKARFAYIHDVFIIEKYRGRDLSKWLMGTILKHPQLQGMKKWALATRDAHDLYRQFGFKKLKDPAKHMEILNMNIYSESNKRS